MENNEELKPSLDSESTVKMSNEESFQTETDKMSVYENIISDSSVKSEESTETTTSTRLRIHKRKSKSRTERIPIESYLAKFKTEKPEKKKLSTEESPNLRCDMPQIKFMDDLHKRVTFTVVRELFVKQNKYKSSPNRYLKMTTNMHRPFLVVEDGTDYTPKKAINANDSRWIREPMLLNFPGTSYSAIKPDDILVRGRKPSTAGLHLDSLSHKVCAKIESSDSESIDSALNQVLSITSLKIPKRKNVNKMRLVFRLKETDTFNILSILSRASEINVDEGIHIHKANVLKQNIESRLRKKMDNYCQTSKDGRKNTKETQLHHSTKLNKYTFSSNWDCFDSFKEIEKMHFIPAPPGFQKTGKVDRVKYADIKSIDEPIIGDNFTIINRLNWYTAAMVMERLLLSNNAMNRQLIFYDLMKPDPMSDNIQFKYTLQHLWTFKMANSAGKSVTCMSWNMAEPNILAVGYGKYNFTDKNKGIVSIWNNKNLAHPERQYMFDSGVTSVRFCKSYSNVLAIAFYTGKIIIIDIFKRETIKLIAKNTQTTFSSLSPVWDIQWKMNINNTGENIVECRGNGYVYEYTRRHLYEKKQIMKISKMKGRIKGIPHQKQCQTYVIPLVRSPAILCIAFHPADPSIYYIGTDEGGVYKCTTQDVYQHLDMFLAHNGPVYTIQFHPACSKIFLTCGADWYIRVWGDGIFTPLLMMNSGMSVVQSALWCPNHPTIIVAITNTKIELWDISRRIAFPQAVFENPQQLLNTSLAFSKCGYNLCVGDKGGNVHIYALSNMPFTPVNADMVLALILIKALTPNRKLLMELYKLGPPFNVPRIYKNYLNI